MIRFSLVPSVLAFAATIAAQGPVLPVIPFAATQDLLVVDSSNDCVWRLSDFSQEGNYNGANEVLLFYSDIGNIALTNPTCIVVAPNGRAYVADSTEDKILELVDLDWDGAANSPGEFNVFFDSATNASGITMASAQGITVDYLGRLFVANSNAGTSGIDQILVLQDLNGDGDANDVGEAYDYCTIPGGSGAVGNSIPTKVIVGPDFNVYYTDVASSGSVVKGVYRLADLNGNGNCNDPGEQSLYWTPTAASSPFYWSLAVDTVGNFYVTDHSANYTIWRGRDLDGNGTIDAGTEDQVFYSTTATGGSTWWDIVVRDDGWILVLDAKTHDRVTALKDLNGDGDATDPGESFDAYDELIGASNVQVRGAAFQRAPLQEVVPTTVALGSTTTVTVATPKPGDLALVVISPAVIPPISLPPLGFVRVDPNFVPLYLGLANASSQVVYPLAVPATAAIGTYGLQSLAGDFFRLYLTNANTLTTF